MFKRNGKQNIKLITNMKNFIKSLIVVGLLALANQSHAATASAVVAIAASTNTNHSS